MDQLQTVPAVLQRLAELWGITVKQHKLEVPAAFGSGYCSGYVFNQHIRMMLLHYELKEELVIGNPEINDLSNRILFKFQHLDFKTGTESDNKVAKPIPSVLIATSHIHAGDVTVHSNTATLNIEVDAGYLKEMLQQSDNSPVLRGLLENGQPLLFDQMIFPALEKIVDEMINEKIAEPFGLFLLRIKAEELICRLLMELEKRNDTALYPVNMQDVQALYRIKNQMLAQLDTPPVIDQLAAAANMSATKLKRLFKQIFGNSVFNYYQQFRMKEAARLLREENMSVSDAGYQMGFSNLSHFTRVFQEHIGKKPKQYSRDK